MDDGTRPQLKCRRVRPDGDGDIPLPRYMTDGAAGMDLCAAVSGERVLPPGEVVLVPTGFAVAVPPGYEAQIRPRSGLAVRNAVTVVNAPGTIDADYRGEIQVALINLGRHPYTLLRGDRIAQMIIAPVARVDVQEVDQLDDSARGDGGFGHTGR